MFGGEMERVLRAVPVCFVVFAPLGWAAEEAGNNSGSNSLQNVTQTQLEKLVKSGRSAFYKGSYEEADRIYQKVIKQAEAAGVQGVLLARTTYELGAMRKVEGRCDEAVPLIQRGLAMLTVYRPRPGEASGLYPGEITTVWEVLGAARACDYDYTQAEHAYHKALEAEQTSPAPRRHTLFEIQSNLGSVYQEEGKYPQAQANYEAAQALQDDPQVDPISRALLAGTYGPLLRALGREAEAADMIQSGLAAVRTAAGSDGSTAVILLNAMALIQTDRKAYGEAAQLLAEAIDRMDKGAAFRPGDRARVLRNYALCLRKMGEKKRAREIESQAAQLTAGLRPDATRGPLVDVSELAAKH